MPRSGIVPGKSTYLIRPYYSRIHGRHEYESQELNVSATSIWNIKRNEFSSPGSIATFMLDIDLSRG